MKCRVCNSLIIKFLSLGKMPLVNSFLKKKDFPLEEKFDLGVAFCPQCYLVQLLKTVDPKKLFRNYIYFSSTSKTILEYNQLVVKYLSQRFKFNSHSLILEIASNDGAFLQHFKKLGIQILGIDPAENIAKIANKKGIPTLPKFFNYSFAKKLKEKQKIQADLVYGANVLAHVPKIVDFVKGVKVILKPKGTAIFEFPYLQGILKNKFDTIYHEHVFYYSLSALGNLFKKAGLKIYDVEMTEMQGGSLRIFASHPKNFAISQKVKNLLDQEIKKGFNKIETYRLINKNAGKLKNELLNLLKKFKKQGKKIVAYGAAAKGNVLLNYFGINANYLDFIADKSLEKQGLYTPGTHLLVCPPEKIDQEMPDYVLILCWNIADEITKQLKNYHDAGGKFIIPIPNLKII